MDFLMGWQSGIKNIAASSGTALTPDHLRSLRRMAEEIILSFDNDEAGSAASERAIDLAAASDFGVRVASFGSSKDLAEAATKNPSSLQDVLGKAVAAPLFYFDKYLPSPGVYEYGDRKNIRKLRVVLSKVNGISSLVEKNFWFKKLSERTGVEERVLAEEAERIGAGRVDFAKKDESSSVNAGSPHSRSMSRRELIEERLLRAAASVGKYDLIDDCVPYLSASYGSILGFLKKGIRSSDDPRLDEMLNFVILGSENMDEKEISELKTELIKEHVKEKRIILAAAVKKAEENGNENELRAALEELSHLTVLISEA